MVGWSALPADIIGSIYDRLDVEDVVNLASVSKNDADRVETIALPSLLRRTALNHLTFRPIGQRKTSATPGKAELITPGSAIKLIRHNTIIRENFRSKRFLSRQVGPTWDRPCRPVLEVEADRLLVATGQCLTMHDLVPSGRDDDGRRGAADTYTVPIPIVRTPRNAIPRTAREGWSRFAPNDGRPSPLDDMTGLVALGRDQYVISTVGGRLQRIELQRGQYRGRTTWQAVSKALYQHPRNIPIESLCVSRCGDDGEPISQFLTASHSGLVSLYNTAAPWSAPLTFELGTRPWSSLLQLEGSRPFVAVGTSGLEPLKIYTLGEGGAFTTPGRTASTVEPMSTLVGAEKKSAVYDIKAPDPNMAMPFSGNPTSILLSAWFDGKARVHDVRMSGTSSLTSGLDPGHAMYTRPVLEAHDPWIQSSLYSCAWTGAGNIAAGSSRHGMVSFYDTRMILNAGQLGTNVNPVKRAGDQSGYSIYTPGQPESPVYDLVGEGGRVWGVTHRRVFVAAFDVQGDRPGSTEARGWDVVRPNCEVNAGVSRVDRRTGKRGGVDEIKDYAVGYALGDPQLRVFESLQGY